MFLHIITILCIVSIFCLLKYPKQISKFLGKVYDIVTYRIQEREDISKHKGMYEYYHED